jgi:GDP-L-fucose synthase
MELNSKIFVAGHKGLVGSAIIRKLKELGYTNIITADKSEVDLTDQSKVRWFLSSHVPDYVFLAAAKVGGIQYNQNFPAEFIYQNLQIQNNVIHEAYRAGVTKLLFLGSSCIYPKLCPQPIKEEYLLSDYLEPSNEAYAVAKIAGVEMSKMYRRQYGFNSISVMPTNLYGINDNFNIEQCHVIPAMINKFIDAKNNNKEFVTLFGDGSPFREFLYVDDLAEACIFLMNNYEDENHINIGSPYEYSIKETAQIVADKVGYTGNIIWDTDKPNGTPRKKLDTSKLDNLGWLAKTTLDQGLETTINWYLEFGGIDA